MNQEKEQEEINEDDRVLTHKEAAFAAILQADSAHSRLIALRENVEAIFGEESPIAQDLADVEEFLDQANGLVYTLGLPAVADFDECYPIFAQWLDENTETA